MFNEGIYKMPEHVATRWASPENPRGEKGAAGQANHGRKGAASLPLKAGESYVLAQEENASGTIRRIWMTISDRKPEMLRGLRLDFYWDGAETPAVSAPLGDFFGIGMGRTKAFQSALFANPEGRSFNCFIPMPFRKGMRMVITNESSCDLSHLFYDVNYTINDAHGEDMLYFHAHYRREPQTQYQQDYTILPNVQGKGRFLGSNIGVKADTDAYLRAWWGEGEVKVYIDGDDAFPTLCGTGTEDYIGTAWGQGEYAHRYQGCPVADHENMLYCFYRYHLPDPIWFRENARVTIQQIGCWDPESKKQYREDGFTILSSAMTPFDFSENGEQAPYGLFERRDDWSSCAYFYLDKPVNGLPALDPVDKRIS